MADDIPEYLLEPPPGEVPDPPVDTADQLLPFHGLLWENFERLCLRLVRLEGTPEHVQLFGTRGQAQSGIDIYSRLPEGEYAVYQAKRYAEFEESDISAAVDKFLEGEWATTAARFVLCTSRGLVRTQFARGIERGAEELRERDPPVAFEIWDAESLSEKLKAHPELVEDFFGSAWLERFARPAARAQVDERLVDIQASINELNLRSTGRVRVLVLDWAPERLRQAVQEFASDWPDDFERLTAVVGDPPTQAPLAALISEPPGWIRDGREEQWILLARYAESTGAWESASIAWERAAEQADDRTRTSHLVSAAVAAKVGGDAARHAELMEGLDETHPRVQLERLRDDASPEEQLAELNRIEPATPEENLLLAANRGLAYVLSPDLEAAREQLELAQEHGAETAIAEGLALNVGIQQARLNLLAGRPTDLAELEEVRRRALTLRGRLLRERRFEESARLLMIAADALCLMEERDEARTLLRQAQEAELRAPEGAVVLAAAASGRAFDFRLAREFIEYAPDSRAATRIRAEADEEIGGAEARERALAELDALVAADGDESAEAAFVRLAATIGARRTAWSNEAEQYLREHDHERAAVVAKAVYLTQWHADYDAADELLAPYADELWAKTTRLRIATRRGHYPSIREAAGAVMAAGPSQSVRVEAGRGYAICGDWERALEVLLTPARDPSAPPLVRAEAYRLLMRVVVEGLDDLELAKTLLDEWIAVRPQDKNASAWMPTVASRYRAQRRGS